MDLKEAIALISGGKRAEPAAVSVFLDFLQEHGLNVRQAEDVLYAIDPTLAPDWPHHLYDTVRFGREVWRAPEAWTEVPGSSIFEFFRDVSGKGEHETNLMSPRRISGAYRFFDAHQLAVTTNLPQEQLEVMSLRFRINQRVIFEGPFHDVERAGRFGVRLADPYGNPDDGFRRVDPRPMRIHTTDDIQVRVTAHNPVRAQPDAFIRVRLCGVATMEMR